MNVASFIGRNPYDLNNFRGGGDGHRGGVGGGGGGGSYFSGSPYSEYTQAPSTRGLMRLPTLPSSPLEYGDTHYRAAAEMREAGRFGLEKDRFGLEKDVTQRRLGMEEGRFGFEKERFGIEKPLLQGRAESELFSLGMQKRFRPQQEQLFGLQLQQQTQEARSRMRFRSFLDRKIAGMGGAGFGGDDDFGGGGMVDYRSQRMMQAPRSGIPTGGNTFSRSSLAPQLGGGGGYLGFPKRQNEEIV